MRRIFAVLIVVFFLCGCSTQQSSSPNSESIKPIESSSSISDSSLPVSSSDSPLPISANFGEKTGVVDGLAGLNEDLICKWSEISSFLADYEYTDYRIEGLELINGLVGFRVYETPDIVFSVRMQYNTDDSFDLTNVYAALLTENNVLQSGIHCGMSLDEAEEIVNSYNANYFKLDFSDLVLSNYEESTETVHLSTLRLDQFPSGMFDEYNYAISVLYQKTPDSIGQTLCLYSIDGIIIDAISSTLYGAS